ncbi:TPA: hypothetical protein ACXIMI_001684 [Stenotrophomonas maltophilia]
MRIYVGRIITPTPQAAFIEVDNVMLQEGLVATQWIPSTTELSAKVDANAAATNTLTGTVTNLQGQVTAQGTSITTVNANIDQLKQQGSNAVLDGSFENRAVNQGVGVGIVTADAARSGTKSLKIVANGAIRDVSVAIFDNPGDNRVWYAEVWVRNAPGAAVTTGNIQLAATCTLANGGSNYPQFKALAAASVTDSWQKLSGYITVPATTTRLQIRLSIRENVPSGAVLWDDVYAEDVTDSYNAAQTAQGAASGVSALQATVTQQGQDITAQASRIDGVTASVAGKADASVVQEMRATANNKTEGGNLLANSAFPSWSSRTWIWHTNYNAWSELGNPTGDNSWSPPSVCGMGAVKPGVLAADAGDYFITAYRIPVEQGKTYCLSYYASTHRARLYLYVEFYDSAGNLIPGANITANEINNTNTNPVTLATLNRPFAIGVAPANARTCRVVGLVRGIGQDSPYFWIFRPMLSEVPAGCTAPPAWEAGDQSAAEWNMSVQANGISAGLQLGVTGQTSAFNILASAVNILTPGGADGFELTNGYLRVWSGNSQRIIGNNFGADGLVDYFGPNVGAANANKTNATMWMDRDGNAYWGGAIAAGNLRNAMQSTSIQTIGNGVLVGPFDTNGRNKQVVVGYNRRHTRISNAIGPDGFVAGAGSNSGVINLYRQLNGQNETLWQQIPISGRVDIFNEPDTSDRAVSYWSASVTLNDSSDGATRRSYRAEIVSYSEQSVTHQSGSFTSQTITQSLSIVSIEQ